MSTARGQFTGAGFLGQGTNVVTVKRIYNQFLAAQTLSAQTRLLLLTHRLKHPMDLKDLGVEYHRRVFEAVRERDTERATKELHKHLRASFDGIVGSVEAIEPKGLIDL